jgi:hypothetical protein
LFHTEVVPTLVPAFWHITQASAPRGNGVPVVAYDAPGPVRAFSDDAVT